MHYLNPEQNFLKTLKEKKVNEDLAYSLLYEIGSISEQYSLKIGEQEEIYGLISEFVQKNISYNAYIEKLFEKLGVSEEEKKKIAELLEIKVISKIQTEVNKKEAESRIRLAEEELKIIEKELKSRA